MQANLTKKKDGNGQKLSKYVISNIILFLPFKTALSMRLVSKRFDEAVLIGFNCLYFDLQNQVDRYQYLLENEFDQQTQEEHKELSERELLINTDLRKFLKNADKGSTLFKNCKEIAYLSRPNHLITKPFIAVLILIGKNPKIKPDVNYMVKEDID